MLLQALKPRGFWRPFRGLFGLWCFVYLGLSYGAVFGVGFRVRVQGFHGGRRSERGRTTNSFQIRVAGLGLHPSDSRPAGGFFAGSHTENPGFQR